MLNILYTFNLDDVISNPTDKQIVEAAWLLCLDSV